MNHDVLIQVGERLKSARIQRGAGLEEISQGTRISKRHLTAMEEGNFEKLPTEASMRGFLKLYAEYLGLDVESFYSDFLKALLPNEETLVVPPKPAPFWYAIFTGSSRRGN